MHSEVAPTDTRCSCGPEFQILLIIYQQAGIFVLCRLSAMEYPWFALLYLSCLAISFQTLRTLILTLI